jgi:hypothetical protein
MMKSTDLEAMTSFTVVEGAISYPAVATLTGGANADTFVLGAQSYYNFYTGSGFALITDFNSSEGDKIALFETLDKYTLVSGNFGYGTAALDTKILFGNDEIGVLQDITNLTSNGLHPWRSVSSVS